MADPYATPISYSTMIFEVRFGYALTSMNVLPTFCEGYVEATARSNLIKRREVREVREEPVTTEASNELYQQ